MHSAITTNTRLVAVALLGGLAVIWMFANSFATAQVPADNLPPSRITKENFDRIAARKGTMTEDEVVAMLGPPTLIRSDAALNRDYNIVWEHRTFIELELRNDRVCHITGAFSPYVTSEVATPENFKKLSIGMSEDDVRRLFSQMAENLLQDETENGTFSQLPFENRLNLVKKLLLREGFTVEWEKIGDEYHIRETNCPYLQVGQNHPEICEMDQTLISTVLAVPSEKVKCILNGDQLCTYVISKADLLETTL